MLIFPTTYPVELEEHTSKKRSTMAYLTYAREVRTGRADPSIPEEQLTAETGENIDYVAMSKSSSVRAHVFLFLWRVDYNIKLISIDSFTWAMSQVKWSTSSASGSTTVYLYKGPTTDLHCIAVMDLQSLYTIEPLLSFLKESFYGGGLGSVSPKSHLIDQDKGTQYIFYKGIHPICDIIERTLGTTNSMWKELIHQK
ncbi:La-related protein 6 [Hordeum vulgare]|nr:La-related protein 6 [Hordeum vulgare]